MVGRGVTVDLVPCIRRTPCKNNDAKCAKVIVYAHNGHKECMNDVRYHGQCLHLAQQIFLVASAAAGVTVLGARFGTIPLHQ